MNNANQGLKIKDNFWDSPPAFHTDFAIFACPFVQAGGTLRSLRYKSEYESCIAKIAKKRKGHCTTFRPLSSFVCVTAFYTLFVF